MQDKFPHCDDFAAVWLKTRHLMQHIIVMCWSAGMPGRGPDGTGLSLKPDAWPHTHSVQSDEIHIFSHRIAPQSSQRHRKTTPVPQGTKP